MKKLKIIEINNYDYTLQDTDNKKYTLNIEFQNIDNKPNINDYIYISEKILNEINIFTFGSITKENTNINEDELIKIVSNNKEYYLQRYYG